MKNILASCTRLSLVWRIVIGLIIGTLLGLFLPQTPVVALLGKLFVGALKAIAPVLVFVLVASALANATGMQAGPFRTLIFRYLLTTVIAALVAVAASTIAPVTLRLSEVPQMQGEGAGSLKELFQNILMGIVTNPVSALCNANYLSILFWALLTGAALNRLASCATKKVVADCSEVVAKCVKWIIQFVPLRHHGSCVCKRVGEWSRNLYYIWSSAVAAGGKHAVLRFCDQSYHRIHHPQGQSLSHIVQVP